MGEGKQMSKDFWTYILIAGVAGIAIGVAGTLLLPKAFGKKKDKKPSGEKTG